MAGRRRRSREDEGGEVVSKNQNDKGGGVGIFRYRGKEITFPAAYFLYRFLPTFFQIKANGALRNLV